MTYNYISVILTLLNYYQSILHESSYGGNVMSKNLTENYPIVDTVEALEERLAGVREAQRIFAAYTQEQ